MADEKNLPVTSTAASLTGINISPDVVPTPLTGGGPVDYGRHRLSFHRPNYFPPFYHTQHADEAIQRRRGSELAKLKALEETEEKKKAGESVPDFTSAEILTNENYNKGTAFSQAERRMFHVDGLLPSAVETMDLQLQRVWAQFNTFECPMNKYTYLNMLRHTNTTLFHKFILTHLKDTLHIIYTPTVGQACITYSENYRAAEGMFLSSVKHMGRVHEVLANWKNNIADDVAIIVVTDGSRILGLGDLGLNGMGIPIGKTTLYVAAGGFHPLLTLPVCLDVGTNNQKFLDDPFYMGERKRRDDDKTFYKFADEFMAAVQTRWPYALVQFEDFSNDHCFELLDRWKNKALCFNDDIQGTGAVVAAGLVNACKVCGHDIRKTKFMVVGAGSAGIGIVTQTIRLIRYILGRDDHGGDVASDKQLAKNIILIDSKGIVHNKRSDIATLADFKKPFANELPFPMPENPKDLEDLEKLVELAQPHAIIGLSGQGGVFTEPILKKMGEINPKPIIFPLSNPTSKSECTLEQACLATDCRVVFASGSPMPPFVSSSGEVFEGSQGNNLYAFPGIGFGAWVTKSHLVSDAMLTAAALAIADSVEPSRLSKGLLYPDLDHIRDVSVKVASAVALQAADEGLCLLPDDIVDVSLSRTEISTNMQEYVKKHMYCPEYLEMSEE